MATETKPGYCTLCRSRCGTLNTVVDGRLTKVEPLPGHPTGAAICAKGRAAPEIADGTNRLLYPMRRTRPKTSADPGWQRIGWDEALDTIAARLLADREGFGAESVAFALSSPAGTALGDSYDWMERLVWLYGSPNVCNATEVCNWPKDFAHRFTFGHGMPPPDYARSDVVMLWGFNPAVSWLAHASAIAEAAARGATLIVVDPRKVGFATQATEWLPIKPGTDGILAMGLANLLITSNRFDDAFVRRWTTAPLLVRADTGAYLRWSEVTDGPDHYVAWDEAAARPVPYDPSLALPPDDAQRLALRGSYAIDVGGAEIECRPAFELYAAASADYPLDRVALLTGIAADAIERTATALSGGVVSYHCWTGISQHAHATQTERAIALLYALTGSFDAPGGNLVLNRQPANRVNNHALLPEAQQRKALGLAQRPLGPPVNGWITATDLYTAIIEKKPYEIRTLIAFGSNILSSLAEPVRGRQALERLKFQVHCDLYETPTMRFADIILPINSPWEREGLRVGFENTAAAEELIQLRPQMVESRGESRSDAWVVFQLATRLGLAAQFFGGEIEAGWDHMLTPLGFTVAQLRQAPYGLTRPVAQQARKYANVTDSVVAGFPTPSKRVEIYSEQLLRHGQAPLPVFATSDDNDERYPLTLTTARNSNYCHSQHRAVASLRKRATAPTAEIGTEVARRLRLRNGDWIAIETPTARARFRVRLNAAMNSETVVAEYGWWDSCDDLALPGYALFGKSSSNYNGLIAADLLDPVSGSTALRSTRCRITPLRDARGRRDLLPLRVETVTTEAEDVVTVTLRGATGASLPPCHPGEHIILQHPDDDSLVRAYSISGRSDGARQGAYRISVKATPTSAIDPRGSFSRIITQSLKPGDMLLARPPAGAFRLPLRSRHPIVLVAAGIGITPFIAYLETLQDTRPDFSVTLYYGNANGRSHAFRHDLRRLARELPLLRVVDHYSRPDPEDRLGVDYDIAGRIDAGHIDAALIEQRARFYLCGPDAMATTVSAGLQERGVRPYEIYRESFQLPSVPVAADAALSFTIRLATSQRDFVWTASAGSILDAAFAQGLRLPGGCRAGQCGNCALKLLSGSVRSLIEDDHSEPDVCLSCQSVPLSDLTLQA